MLLTPRRRILPAPVAVPDAAGPVAAPVLGQRRPTRSELIVYTFDFVK
jgi:hypothetical protein